MPVYGAIYYGTTYYGTASYGGYGAIPTGLTGPSMSDVIIAAHGDRGRTPLQCGGLRASWEVNQTGDFSAFARIDDVREIVSSPADLLGYWLMWEHPYLGDWGGVITDVRVQIPGVVEIAAQGWLALLDKRLTRRRDVAVMAHAGAIAARLVHDAGAVNPTGIVETSFDASGDFVSWRDAGAEVLSSLGRLAQMSDQDFGVGESDRIFYWRSTFGSDIAHRVQLVQGTHIASWRPSWALGPVVNEVVLSSSNADRFVQAKSISGHDATAYSAYGPRQMRGTYRGLISRSAVQSIAQRQAERFSRRGKLIELSVVNHDGCFAWFRRGDTITALLPDIDAALRVRVLLMSWDQDSDVMRVSGEIVE